MKNKILITLMLGLVLLSLTFVSASFGYNNRDLIIIRTLNDTLDPKWTANYTNMLTVCPTGNYSYGIFENGTFKCRSDEGAGADTNETTRFNTLVGTDCGAGNYSYGFDANGLIQCRVDTTGAGGASKNTTGLYLYNDSTTIYFNTTLAGTNLSVNSSDYWDNFNSHNTTHFSNDGGVLTLVQSWIESFFNALFGAKDTDDLTEGSNNLYDDTDWNKTYGDELYSTIDEPLWSTNYTNYNNSWTSTYNSTYNAYNSTGLIKDWNASGYIIDWNSTGFIINWSGDYLTEETLWNANYSDFLIVSVWNDTGLIQDWNASGHIKDWSGASSDATWVANWTAYNTTWSQDTTYSDLSEFNDDILWTSVFNSTGNTLWTTETYVNLQNTSMKNYVDGTFLTSFTELDPFWTGNQTNMLTDCPTGNYSYGIFNNGTYKCRSDTTGAGDEVDPKWSANYTAYNESWSLDTNTWDTSWFSNWTAYNTTWSTDTTYSQGTNMTFDGTTINWDGSWAVSVFAWASDLLSKVSWTDLWNQVYNETEVDAINTSMKNYVIEVNTSMQNYVDNEFVELSGDTMTGNLTIGTNSLLNQTGGARIYHNGTGWLIIG